MKFVAGFCNPSHAQVDLMSTRAKTKAPQIESYIEAPDIVCRSHRKENTNNKTNRCQGMQTRLANSQFSARPRSKLVVSPTSQLKGQYNDYSVMQYQAKYLLQSYLIDSTRVLCMCPTCHAKLVYSRSTVTVYITLPVPCDGAQRMRQSREGCLVRRGC